MAALGPEMTRRPPLSRVAFEQEGAATIDRIADALPLPIEGTDRRPRAFAVFAHMLGTLQMARLMSAEPLSSDILSRGRQEALRLAGYTPMDQSEHSEPPSGANKHRMKRTRD